jgi:hypothetical protein
MKTVSRYCAKIASSSGEDVGVNSTIAAETISQRLRKGNALALLFLWEAVLLKSRVLPGVLLRACLQLLHTNVKLWRG